jgi:hypothetical protein
MIIGEKPCKNNDLCTMLSLIDAADASIIDHLK